MLVALCRWLFGVWCMMRVACCLMCVVSLCDLRRLLFVACYLLVVVCWLFVRCLLFPVRCVMSVVCCSLFPVCCSLFGVCCLFV